MSVMRELEERFRSLDRIAAPDQWNEVVARAAELEAAVPRRQVSRAFVLIAAALLLVALVGALALGLRLIRPAPDQLVRYTNGMIVGVAECELVGLDPTSGSAEVLVPGPPDCSPNERLHVPTAMSSDGRFLAYVVSRYCGACFEEPSQEALDGQGAWIYDTKTGENRQLEPCPERYCEEIDISPDGSLVAYTARGRNQEHGLIVVDVDSSRSSRMELTGASGRPRFSPTGGQIVFAIQGSGLYAVDVTEFANRPTSALPEPTLVYGGDFTANPVWSPDGVWIAFESQSENRESGIWLVRADGTDARALATEPGHAGPSQPAWSPDGTRLAYLRMSKLELWTVGIDGGEPTRIYQSTCCEGSLTGPEWSPDGEYIALGVGNGEPASGLMLIRPDGTEARQIVDYPFNADWQPIPIESPAD